jgi:hypothetical protein
MSLLQSYQILIGFVKKETSKNNIKTATEKTKINYRKFKFADKLWDEI